MSWARMWRWAAVATGGASVLLVLLAVRFAVAAPETQNIVYVAIASVIGLCSVVIGLVVAQRKPDNAVGFLMVANGFVPIWAMSGDLYAIAVARNPGMFPVSSVHVTASQGSWMFLYVPAALLMLVFPDGRLLTRRWRIVATGFVVVPLAFVVLAGMEPVPFAPPFQEVPHAWGSSELALFIGLTLLPVFMALLISSTVAMALRYRRTTDPVRRAQVKWFALGALCLPGTLMLCWASYLIFGEPDLVMFGLAITFVAIPVAMAIALLRHDLYDVDRAFSAAVTYGLVTVLVLAFYTVASAVAGWTVGGTSTLAAAAATAVCAAALSPLRHRLQRAVDKRFYPQRQAALAALDDLRARSRHGDAQPEELEAVLRQALKDPELLVGYRMAGELVGVEGKPLAAFAPGRETPVVAGGEQIGAIIRGNTGTATLMRDLAAASSMHVELVRLRMRLNTALHEAESSRSRLLLAGYAERRRLERDLHDGAQQRLVSLGMALRLGQRQVRTGSVDVDGLLDQAVAELGTAVAELRQLAHGLRPSSLDDGLDTALRMLARNIPMPVQVDVQIGHVPEDVATTVYFVASEALANAVKHAGATSIGLQLAHHGDQLKLRVSDDGTGGASRQGAGLNGMFDRIAAAGGNLRIASVSGQGTTIEAVLPCAS